MSVLTACITPFKADLSIDFSALESIIRSQEHAGNGIFLFGSTGEGLSVAYEEKFSILSFILFTPFVNMSCIIPQNMLFVNIF